MIERCWNVTLKRELCQCRDQPSSRRDSRGTPCGKEVLLQVQMTGVMNSRIANHNVDSEALPEVLCVAKRNAPSTKR